MSLKSTFLAFKKSGTSCPNWGEGIFFVKTSLMGSALYLAFIYSLFLYYNSNIHFDMTNWGPFLISCLVDRKNA